VAAAEEEARSLQFLSKAVEERMLEEKFDNVRAPYKEPRRPKPLPYQLDLLSYYAKEALRARNTTEAVRIYQRCTWLPALSGCDVCVRWRRRRELDGRPNLCHVTCTP
jgi:hypothetical protein